MAITSVAPIENRMIAVSYCVYTRTSGHVWRSDLQWPATYAVIVLNGDSKAHLEVVTEYQPLDQAQLLSWSRRLERYHMTINCVWEHNGRDTLLYAVDFVGAYTRGETLEAAVRKMQAEIWSVMAAELSWSTGKNGTGRASPSPEVI